jgi:hypothetical protein
MRSVRYVYIARQRRSAVRRRGLQNPSEPFGSTGQMTCDRTLLSNRIENMHNCQGLFLTAFFCPRSGAGAQVPALRCRRSGAGAHHACGAWQCGQATVVETGARNT